MIIMIIVKVGGNMSAGEADALIHKVRIVTFWDQYCFDISCHKIIIVVTIGDWIRSTFPFVLKRKLCNLKADKDGNKEIDISEFGELWAAIRYKSQNHQTKVETIR